LKNQLADHAYELRVRADGRRADHVEADLFGETARLGVEVVEHLHVVGDEADGGDDNVRRARLFQPAQVFADVRAEPGLRRRPGAALEDETPTGVGRAFGDEAAGLKQLPLVVAARGHRRRDAVRGEGDVSRGATPFGDLSERGAQAQDVRPDEAGVVEEGAQLLDARRAFAYRRARSLDVFAVLPAARIRTISRNDEGERALDSVVPHLPDGVGQERVPVAVAPVDGQARPSLFKLAFERRDEFSVLPVDGA